MTKTHNISYECKDGQYRTIRIAFDDRNLGQMGPRQFATFQADGTGVRVSWANMNGAEAHVDETGGVW